MWGFPENQTRLLPVRILQGLGGHSQLPAQLGPPQATFPV